MLPGTITADTATQQPMPGTVHLLDVGQHCSCSKLMIVAVALPVRGYSVPRGGKLLLAKLSVPTIEEAVLLFNLTRLSLSSKDESKKENNKNCITS